MESLMKTRYVLALRKRTAEEEKHVEEAMKMLDRDPDSRAIQINARKASDVLGSLRKSLRKIEQNG